MRFWSFEIFPNFNDTIIGLVIKTFFCLFILFLKREISHIILNGFGFIVQYLYPYSIMLLLLYSVQVYLKLLRVSLYNEYNNTFIIKQHCSLGITMYNRS